MEEIEKLKQELLMKEKELNDIKANLALKQKDVLRGAVTDSKYEVQSPSSEQEISNLEIARYSRQLILPEIGIKGQRKLKSSSVLIVGAGGLGCPAAVYLAAAGIGRLGIVDYDAVELSNLHRQILHTEQRENVPKSSSAAHACNQLNSKVECIPYYLCLNSGNAFDLIKQYDVVVDATDNVASRYLLNDACVLLGKPLVSGSALRFEGQLTVYHYKGGPCYRCLFPKPPPPETVTNCSDGGVLGVVPGIIGSIQALEVMKIIVEMGTVHSQRLLLFDALDGTYRSIKLRGRQSTCAVCGDTPTITRLIDYEQFCGAKASDKSKDVSVLAAEDRISVKELKSMLDKGANFLLLDVRQPVETEICALPNSINIPLTHIDKPGALQEVEKHLSHNKELNVPVFVVCRLGNDSQLAVKKLREKLGHFHTTIKDVKGGLTAWAKQIDNQMPVY